MKKPLLLLFLIFSCFSFSQIKYEKAYYITNSDERIECFIKNIDWRNNPSNFEYKINENDDPKIISIANVRAFEVYNQVKFVRSNVNIDTSSHDLNDLTSSRKPIYEEKQIFLKELVPGDIRLYNYTSGNTSQFFYQVNTGAMEPLVYKIYEIDINKVTYNTDYKKQLEKLLVCSSLSSQNFSTLEYKEKRLVDLFKKYHLCKNPSNIDDQIGKNKGKFNLNIRPRINSSSAEFLNPPSKDFYDMENKIGFGFGIEVEYILPFNKNKWSVIVEPTYQSYKSEKTTNTDFVVGGKITTKANYKSIEIPIGIRHHMFINDKSRMFINLQYVLDFASNSEVEIRRADNTNYSTIEIKSNPNFALGFGYNYNNKYSVEARLYTNRNITSNYRTWDSNYKTVSLIFGYNIFSR